MNRAIITAFSILMIAVVSRMPVSAETPQIYAVHLSGVISSLSSARVIRTIRAAESNHATAVLIEVDSPGGTEAAVQEITRASLSATVPIIVYVDQSQDAEALSGAMFITLAANVAAMNPDATLGAGNPESLSDTTSTDTQQDRMSQTLQFATNTASARDRNVDAITAMIQKNANLTADEATAQGVIDLVAPNIDGLLAQIDGKEVQTLAGPVTIHSANARIVWQKASWHELVLQKITDPNVAYILFSVGAMLLVVELFNPGRLIAGIPGIIALAAAFVAFGNMPVSWLGVGFMAAAFLLFIRELFTPKVTIVGPIGVALFLIGSFTLYRPVRQTSAIVPAVGVTLWVIIVTTAMLVIIMLLMMRAIFHVRHGMTSSNASWLVGADGIVLQALQPRGVIRVRGQEWTAVTEGRTVMEGDHVRVESVDAGVLHVLPENDRGPTDKPRESPTRTPRSSAGT
jgi:membrane-bound serine protease (ClpP class)